MHSPGPKIGVTHAVTKVQHQGRDHLCWYHRLKRRSGLHMQAPQSRIDGGSLQAGTLPEAAAKHALFPAANPWTAKTPYAVCSGAATMKDSPGDAVDLLDAHQATSLL